MARICSWSLADIDTLDLESELDLFVGFFLGACLGFDFSWLDWSIAFIMLMSESLREACLDYDLRWRDFACDFICSLNY